MLNTPSRNRFSPGVERSALPNEFDNVRRLEDLRFAIAAGAKRR
jgi:hypothetical protein